MTINFAVELFTSEFEKAQVENGVKPLSSEQFGNGTGYYDGAVYADFGLVPGQVQAMLDEFSRRALVVGTRFGNVVLFERYSPDETGVRSQTLVCNMPDKINSFVKNTVLSHNQVDSSSIWWLIGPGCNIGKRIENLFEEESED